MKSAIILTFVLAVVVCVFTQEVQAQELFTNLRRESEDERLVNVSGVEVFLFQRGSLNCKVEDPSFPPGSSVIDVPELDFVKSIVWDDKRHVSLADKERLDNAIPFVPFPQRIRDKSSTPDADWQWFKDDMFRLNSEGTLLAFRRCSGDKDKPACLRSG